MTYTTAQGRQQIVDAIATAVEEIGVGLALLGEAYEHLDERSGGRLETELFAPLRSAYGLARRVLVGFAGRHGLEAPQPPGARRPAPSSGVRELVGEAVLAGDRAEGALVELQDSMLPVEVGDEELRAGIAGVRELIGGLRGGAREFVRTLGR